jgi:hypothetical protein
MARIAIFWSSKSQGERFAKQLRLKADRQSDRESLKLAADEMVRQTIGRFPSEETADPWDDPDKLAALEVGMRQVALDYLEGLEETQSYSWGLAIAGIFHLWERDTRRAVSELLNAPSALIKKIERAKFKDLCAYVKSTGFDISSSTGFAGLECANLISNTIKHGEGSSSKELVALRPDLFLDRHPSGTLRLGASHFDEAAKAIEHVWSDYESCVLDAPSAPA